MNEPLQASDLLKTAGKVQRAIHIHPPHVRVFAKGGDASAVHHMRHGIQPSVLFKGSHVGEISAENVGHGELGKDGARHLKAFQGAACPLQPLIRAARTHQQQQPAGKGCRQQFCDHRAPQKTGHTSHQKVIRRRNGGQIGKAANGWLTRYCPGAYPVRTRHIFATARVRPLRLGSLGQNAPGAATVQSQTQGILFKAGFRNHMVSDCN